MDLLVVPELGIQKNLEVPLTFMMILITPRSWKIKH